jgi:hypothetical protein
MCVRVLRHVAKTVVILAVAGFLGATLVRVSPGYGIDQREFDPGLNEDSIRAIRAERNQEQRIYRFYALIWVACCVETYGFP